MYLDHTVASLGSKFLEAPQQLFWAATSILADGHASTPNPRTESWEQCLICTKTKPPGFLQRYAKGEGFAALSISLSHFYEVNKQGSSNATVEQLWKINVGVLRENGQVCAEAAPQRPNTQPHKYELRRTYIQTTHAILWLFPLAIWQQVYMTSAFYHINYPPSDAHTS